MSSNRVGERSASVPTALMARDESQIAEANTAAGSATSASAMCLPPAPLSEIKIPVPKAAASFPLLSAAAEAGIKRERVNEACSDDASGSIKRVRESPAAAVTHEVAMLLQDAAAEGSSQLQHLESIMLNSIKSDDKLRKVSSCAALFQFLNHHGLNATAMRKHHLTIRCHVMLV
jgi:hypothetical protein